MKGPGGSEKGLARTSFASRSRKIGLTRILATVALGPAMVGPLPLAEIASAQMISARVCGGGSIEIPLEREGPSAPAATLCCAKGCFRSRDKAKTDEPE